MSETILITGAAGQLGQAIIHHLLETYGVPAASIVAGTRSPEKLGALAAKGVTVRAVDFDDPATLPAALSGIDRLLIVSTDSLDTPGKRLKQHMTAIDGAVAAGVKHIVYTSMPSPDRSLVTFAPDHLGTEAAIAASGISFTILRNAWYMDNYLMGMPHNLKGGAWYTAMGDGRVANIARDDCALAAAAVLASETSQSATYTLTGTQSLNSGEIAAIVATAAGRPLSVVPVTDEQLGEGMRGAGLPAFVADMLVSADANIRAGNFAAVTTDFETLTGKQPQLLENFLADHKAALA